MTTPGTTICGTFKAPAGWWCSREIGHEGPCAARHNVYLEALQTVERIAGRRLVKWEVKMLDALYADIEKK